MAKVNNRRQKPQAVDNAAYKALIDQLWSLRNSMQEQETIMAPWMAEANSSYRASARNLTHYLALRHADRRPLQESLDRIGVSSLGRAESNVLANLDKVLGILLRLVGETLQPHCEDEPASIESSRKLLEQHTTALLGPPPPGNLVRIMVTLPPEAAGDFSLATQLIDAGMDIARINCAHDGPAEWRTMAENVRRAAQDAGRQVRILMDLGGPKLRTGPVAPGPAVIKLRPKRDEFGKVQATARVGLRPRGSTVAVEGATTHLDVDVGWASHLARGDHLDFEDASGAKRSLAVLRVDGDSALAECDKTAHLIAETKIRRRRKGLGRRTTRLHDVPAPEGTLRLERGAHLRLTRDDGSISPSGQRKKWQFSPPQISCTLPEIFEQVKIGERIWFDDGRIGGIIRHVDPNWIDVEIIHARDNGEKLAGDKGINLPDSQLELPALTTKDCDDLAVVVKLADLVGLSFVQRAADVKILRTHLHELSRPDLGIVLKIETRRGFENLAELLYSAMANKAVGVMIARGDLAVECGYERMAEVQEEILWAAEAAHMPVIWATQVLETLAKTGVPTRAEITDAAMGERAECVMLNKGPHIIDAMRTLNDILQRMQAHHDKKRPLLRALHAWMSTPNSDKRGLYPRRSSPIVESPM